MDHEALGNDGMDESRAFLRVDVDVLPYADRAKVANDVGRILRQTHGTEALARTDGAQDLTILIQRPSDRDRHRI